MMLINFKQSSHTDALWVRASDLFRFALLEFLFTHSLIEIDYKKDIQCGMKNESYYASNPSFLLYNMLTLTFTVYSSPMYWAVTFIRGTFGDTNSSIYTRARMTMILI